MRSRGETILGSRPSEEQKKRVIHLTIGGADHVDEVFASMTKSRIGIPRFRDEARSILKKEFHKSFDNALNRVLEEIGFDSIHGNLDFIVKQYGVNIDKNKRNDILSFIKTKAKSRFFLTPFEFAKLLHKALLSHNPSTYVPVYHLEDTIREAYFFPQVIDLGNLNWVGHLSEKLSYTRLVLKYDFAKSAQCDSTQEKIVLCSRKKGVDEPLSESFLAGFYKCTELNFET